MKASIPQIRESIKDASMRELNDFLEKIRKFSPKIGELAICHIAKKLHIDPTLYGGKTKIQKVNLLYNINVKSEYIFMLCYSKIDKCIY